MGKMQLTIRNLKEIEKIHKESLKLLGNTGLKITHDKTLKKLYKIGAKIDFQNQIARIPSKL